MLSKNLVDDIRFQYRRIRNDTSPASLVPSVSVQGAFTDGGNNNGTVQDNQDDYELQNYFAGVEGRHSLNFGTRLRAYRDANYTDAGTNGSYTFQSLTDYLNKTPQIYQQTVVTNYTANATLFDAALFYQDDWKVNQRFTFSYGLRWEAQNWINDKNDWGPRVSLAYALDGGGKKPPKTVLRGWIRMVLSALYSAEQLRFDCWHSLRHSGDSPERREPADVHRDQSVIRGNHPGEPPAASHPGRQH